MLYVILWFLIIINTAGRSGATFGASCTMDTDCDIPSEECSGSNCACSTGYTHDGNGVCNGVDCGTPAHPTNGAVTVTGSSYPSTATVTCDSGYSLIGSSPITCSSTGDWTTIPTCSLGSSIRLMSRQYYLCGALFVLLKSHFCLFFP